MFKLVLIAGFAMGTGCASMRIHSQPAPETDFAHYQTYYWAPTSTNGPETVLDQHVRSALKRQLTPKGLKETTLESADFLVGYHVLQEHKVAVADWGNGIYGWAPDVVAYTDGSLVVDFIDPKTHRIIWRGSATSAIPDPGIVNVKRLDKAAAAIVSQYHR